MPVPVLLRPPVPEMTAEMMASVAAVPLATEMVRLAAPREKSEVQVTVSLASEEARLRVPAAGRKLAVVPHISPPAKPTESAPP